MQVYYDRDADLSLLKGKKVAVLGYGYLCNGRSAAWEPVLGKGRKRGPFSHPNRGCSSGGRHCYGSSP